MQASGVFPATVRPSRVGQVVSRFVFCFAIWTIYVHVIVAMQSSFDTLLGWLPLVALGALHRSLWGRNG